MRGHHPRTKRPAVERLMKHVSPEPNTGCWLWTGAVLKSNGYGVFSIGTGAEKRQMTAHRAAYSLLRASVPADREVDHLCRVRCCVNPDHLEVVTHHENTLRRSAAQTHCKRGHEFTAENTKRGRKGERNCRACGPARRAEKRVGFYEKRHARGDA